MTELEWLKQQSGYTDEELKNFESIMGNAKFTSMLIKLQSAVSTAESARAKAEQDRLDWENNYQEKVLPELRTVTQDSLTAKGEAARLKAQLEQARQYGIVPDEPDAAAQVDPPRASGSPDPNAFTREDFARFSQAQSTAVTALNDLNAEHFKLYGSPLPNSQELVDETVRQRKLGHTNFTLRNAWEQKFDVPKKREEIAAAAEQKKIDAAVSEALKSDREKHGANPNTRSGQPSRFATYKASDAGGNNAEPWKTPRSGMKSVMRQPWRKESAAKIAAASGV
jgi:hypothetical protein